jgi:hypothetical protein
LVRLGLFDRRIIGLGSSADADRFPSGEGFDLLGGIRHEFIE